MLGARAPGRSADVAASMALWATRGKQSDSRVVVALGYARQLWFQGPAVVGWITPQGVSGAEKSHPSGGPRPFTSTVTSPFTVTVATAHCSGVVDPPGITATTTS